MRELKYLIVHCTATPEGRVVTGDDIRRWHTGPVSKGGRGWNQVGYADLFLLDGELENLVEYNSDNWVQYSEITNGAREYNPYARNIVYAGGTEKHDVRIAKNTLTNGQFGSMHEYIKDFIVLHPNIIVMGHNQVHATSCPGFNVYDVFGCVIPIKNRKHE